MFPPLDFNFNQASKSSKWSGWNCANHLWFHLNRILFLPSSWKWKKKLCKTSLASKMRPFSIIFATSMIVGKSIGKSPNPIEPPGSKCVKVINSWFRSHTLQKTDGWVCFTWTSPNFWKGTSSSKPSFYLGSKTRSFLRWCTPMFCRKFLRSEALPGIALMGVTELRRCSCILRRFSWIFTGGDWYKRMDERKSWSRDLRVYIWLYRLKQKKHHPLYIRKYTIHRW